MVIEASRPHQVTRFYHVKKDANHDEIVKEFRSLGCVVFETVRTGIPGFPDLVVRAMGVSGPVLHLVEIKNPKTQYGRKGLSESKKKLRDSLHGIPVFAVTSIDNVVNLVQSWRA
jgi:hypothetical protein